MRGNPLVEQGYAAEIAQIRAEREYVNAVLSAAEGVLTDIVEDDGNDPDLSDAIKDVYSFAFDLTAALRKAILLHEMVGPQLPDEHRAELREALKATGAL